MLTDHILSRRGPKRWPPQFFTGQAGCYCCPSASVVGYPTWFYGVTTGASPIRDTDRYTIDTWTSKVDGPTPARSSCQSASVNAVAYIWGGSGSVSPFFYTENNQFSESGNSFTTKTAMTANRFRGAGCAIGDYAYHFCGVNSATTDQRTTYQYDSVGNSWATKTDIPTPARSYQAAITLAGKAYNIAGSDAGASIGDNDEYDSAGDTWAAKTSIISPNRFAASFFGASDKGYLATGNQGGGTLIVDTDEYDQAGDSWSAKANCTTPSRWYSAGCTAGGVSPGYCTGGLSSGGTGLRDHDEYTPDAWTTRTDTPTPARWFATACEAS